MGLLNLKTIISIQYFSVQLNYKNTTKLNKICKVITNIKFIKFNEIVKRGGSCKESCYKMALAHLQQHGKPKRRPFGSQWSQLLLRHCGSKSTKSKKYPVAGCVFVSKWKSISQFIRPITIFTIYGIILRLAWKSV